jgi:hypothetical protein
MPEFYDQEPPPSSRVLWLRVLAWLVALATLAYVALAAWYGRLSANGWAGSGWDWRLGL